MYQSMPKEGIAEVTKQNSSTTRWSYQLQILAGALALLALNFYVARDGFFAIHTAHMNSMHGFWMSLARLAGTHWFRPGWWPYADCGSPFEFLYAPLVPGLVALWSYLAHI